MKLNIVIMEKVISIKQHFFTLIKENKKGRIINQKKQGLMANKLIAYYEEAQNLGGLKAKMRLAVLTLIPSSKAQNNPDSFENIQKFEKAMQELKKEF